ncbi:MAG: hypothetical protein GF364_13435 [Candidatus Lokiarchaeota archaeon]|nr:hypothetical protein [Candidatus Lokiarchaeota archaeon]
MRQEQKINLKKLIIAGSISAALIIILSIPFGEIPAIGSLLFPGKGIWTVPGEVPESETLTISNLDDDVTIYRDQWGIPHIYGTNESDLVFALGYVHAQDRLFQMDIARRLTRGRIAEFYGESALIEDKFNLNMLKDYWANKSYNELKNSEDPDKKELYLMLLNYCDGVNYYIENHRNELPVEYILAGTEPYEWTPVDTLSFAKYMAEMLTWEYSDFYSLMIRNAIGNNNYTELFGLPSNYQIPICPNYGDFSDISPPPSELASNELETEENIDEELVEISSFFIDGINTIPQEKDRIQARKNQAIGSNNWVVNGSKTASGYPILCNDMHLEFNLPGIWYEAHLVDMSSDYNVYGFFLAGVPVPIVGHNNYLAWGFTNTAYDVIDWYYYDVVDDDHYMYKGEVTEYGKIKYNIPVKGGKSEEYIIKTTVHGPVFTDLLSENLIEDIPDSGTDKAIACKWIAQNVTWEFAALYGYSKATNRAEFDIASEKFSCPAQNHVYGDIHGHIGIRPTGKVPIRDDTTYGLPGWHTGNGTMPYNGSKGAGEWIDYLDFNTLPHSENPEQCYLTSANQMIAGPDFLKQYSLQHPLDISEGYRARRINTLLAAGDDLTVDDMKDIQLDVYSTAAGNFTPHLLTALDDYNYELLTSIQQDAYDILDNWDYQMDKDKAAPAIYRVWLEIMLGKTFLDEFSIMGTDYLPQYSILEKLIKEDPNSNWFDDITTPEVEDANDTIFNAFTNAVNGLKEFFDSQNPSSWKWGDIHKREFPHLLGLDAFSYGPVPVNGSGFTVTPSSANAWGNGEVKIGVASWGASERMIIDFSDLNNSVSVIPSGQRGITSSKHYTDQLHLYLQGKYHTQYFAADNLVSFDTSWIESRLYLLNGGG